MNGTITVEKKRIIVAFRYSEAAVEKIRGIALKHSARNAWNAEQKHWRLPHAAAMDILTAFPTFAAEPALAELADRIKEESDSIVEKQIDQWRAIQLHIGNIGQPMPSGKKLYEHQTYGAGWLCEVQRGILADDMGVGKTIQSLAAAKIIRAALGTATVVICPANKISDWKKEADEVGIRPFVHSWAKVPTEPLEKFVLIVDEGHYMQSLSAQRTQKVLDLARVANAVFILTGTPMRNGRPANLFPLLKAINHEAAADKTFYERRYCAAGPRPWTRWDITGRSNLDELKKRTQDCILRRMKSECLDLPAKTRVKLEVEGSSEEYKQFMQVLSEIKLQYRERKAARKTEMESKAAQLSSELVTLSDRSAKERVQKTIKQLETNLRNINAADEMVLLGQLRQAASEAKIPTTIETAEQAIEEGGKVLIFADFRQTTEKIARHFEVEPFYGGLSDIARLRIIENFVDGPSKVFVATLGAGSAGLNLAVANTVILHDRPLTPGDAEQAEDRAYRIGTKWPVTSYWIQVFAIDNQVDKMLEEKLKGITELLGKGMSEIPMGENAGLPAREALELMLGDEE